jgi:hypothetical protein
MSRKLLTKDTYKCETPMSEIKQAKTSISDYRSASRNITKYDISGHFGTLENLTKPYLFRNISQQMRTQQTPTSELYKTIHLGVTKRYIRDLTKLNFSC